MGGNQAEVIGYLAHLRGLAVAEQLMLHGVHGRGGASRDSDFVVDMLDMVGGGAMRDHERFTHVLL